MNRQQAWGILEKEFRQFPEDFGAPLKDIKILEVYQKKLNAKFSEDYIKFLKKYGSAILPGHIICGLAPKNATGYLNQNVIEKTNFYKDQGWPGVEDWYIVSDDGFGNPIGIDPDGKVWLSDHDSGFEKVKLADSFEEFLYKLLTDTLYE